jgi:hypothetical protein
MDILTKDLKESVLLYLREGVDDKFVESGVRVIYGIDGSDKFVINMIETIAYLSNFPNQNIVQIHYPATLDESIRERFGDALSNLSHIELYSDLEQNNNHNIYRLLESDIESLKDSDRELEIFIDISKMISFIYDKKFEPKKIFDKLDVDNSYQSLNDYNKRASLFQALHLPIKLKALRLKYKEANEKGYDELLEKNIDIFQKSISKDIFEKILRVEKDRWNSSKYIEGYKYADITDKTKKLHNCLVSYKEIFNKDIFSIIYDIYSILYIPNYLAFVGLELDTL